MEPKHDPEYLIDLEKAISEIWQDMKAITQETVRAINKRYFYNSPPKSKDKRKWN